LWGGSTRIISPYYNPLVSIPKLPIAPKRK
jgi:hypothetical protein